MQPNRKVFLSCVLIVVLILFIAATTASSSSAPAILPPPKVKIVSEDNSEIDRDRFKRGRKNRFAPTGRQYRQEQYHRKMLYR